MELVVVNAASNISKQVIRRLTAGGQYSRVRFLDFNPYTQLSYSFQREMAEKGVTLDKRMTQSSAGLTHNLEGADKVLYFTHQYTNMSIDKNLFLLGTAAAARELKIKNVTAVCPVEHDFAYSEDEKSWVQHREEAEQRALQICPDMTILESDLVYSDQPSHALHYMAQMIAGGKGLGAGLLSEKAKFKPVSCVDLTQAVAHSMGEERLTGHFAVQGADEHSALEITHLIEGACGKEVGSSKPRNEMLHKLMQGVIDFKYGQTIDGNIVDMMTHFHEHTDESPVQGDSFWEASGLQLSGASLADHYKTGVDAESLQHPSVGEYAAPQLN